MRLGFTSICAASAVFLAWPVAAKEYPIGKPQEKNGLEIGAVYLQPIEMDPPDMMRPAKDFGRASRIRHQGREEQ